MDFFEKTHHVRHLEICKILWSSKLSMPATEIVEIENMSDMIDTNRTSQPLSKGARVPKSIQIAAAPIFEEVSGRQ
jgi:hypothetical protein